MICRFCCWVVFFVISRLFRVLLLYLIGGRFRGGVVGVVFCGVDGICE